MKGLLIIIASVITIASYAQPFNISGEVVDTEDGTGLPGATILMINVKDSSRTKFTNTLSNGAFTVAKLEQAFYKMQVTSMGYKTFTRVLRITGDLNIGTIPLTPDVQMLDEIQIKGDVVPVEKKGDTTLYNVAAYKVNPDASAADLVKKMPGMAIKDGSVESNGETVGQVLLDGKRFFGQDPVLALNTIPAEVVKQVEVFDQMSERSQFTGFDDGNTTKTINVVTKEDRRNGQFGKLIAGYGTDDRHNIEGNINFMKDGRQLTILGMSNDLNKKTFSDSDILGVGGGRRGFGSLFGAAATPTGITQTQSVGVNFSDTWKGRKGKIEASYFFDRSLFSNEQSSYRESFFGDQIRYTDEESSAENENMNHRMNLRLEYNLNENNSILFRPNITFQDNFSANLTDALVYTDSRILNRTENEITGDNIGYRVDSDLTFRHRFSKRGRTFSVNLGANINNSERESVSNNLLVDSLFLYDNTDENMMLNTEFTYTEPIGLSGQLQANYELSNYVRRTVRDGYSYNSTTTNNKNPEPGLSSHFDTDYTVHQPSISLMNRSLQSFFNATLAYQYVGLDSKQTFPTEYTVPKNFNKVLPTLMTRLNLAREQSLFIRYSTNTDIPSAQQLQQVIDNSQPLQMYVGNSALDQSYTHSLMMRYQKTNVDKNTSFSNFILVRGTQDYITNAVYVAKSDSTLASGISLPEGGQIARPINLDGYWNVRDHATWGFLVSKLKTNVNASLGLGYTRIPGLADGINNISQTYNTNGTIGFNSNVSEKIDFSLDYSAGFNLVKNSNQDQDTRYITHGLTGKVNLISPKGQVFRSDINYQVYNGSAAFDTSYLLWNMSVAQKFLKNDLGEISLTVFDLLNQNQSISQNVTSAYFEEVRSLVLKQYFMLTFTYTLRNFSS